MSLSVKKINHMEISSMKQILVSSRYILGDFLLSKVRHQNMT